MRRPDFLCIGSQKAGSLWLYRRLISHPDLWLPFIKELHFFDTREKSPSPYYKQRIRSKLRDAIQEAKSGDKDTPYSDALAALDDFDEILSWDWYLKLFSLAPAGAKAGEITPRYSTLPLDEVRNLRGDLPDAKIVYVIRDPFERALSAFRMFVQRHADRTHDPEFLDLNVEKWFDTGQHTFGNYADFIPRWDKFYDEGSNILYIPFGHIGSHPNRTLRQIESFLGVRPRLLHSGARRKANQTKPFPVPDWVTERLKREMRPHREFLDDRFPRAFVRYI